ncbi:MAG: right-handed parallel beta-helix repeat-containing protein, partial [Opitutaceae bacterium]
MFANANPLFSACRFENNATFALSVGSNSSATVEDSLFLNNSGAPFTAVGGANVIRRSSFIGNTAATTIQQATGSLLVERTIVTGNAGGIGAYSAPLTVRDSLVAGNTGAGITATSSLTLLRVTIADNHATGADGIGGVLIGGNASITDSILWRNSGTRPNTTRERQQLFLTNSYPLTVNGTTIDGLATYANKGAGNSADDPLFVDPPAGDYSLSPLSPAIDTSTATPDIGSLDALGQPRVSGAAADRGALESPLAASATPLRISHDLADRVTFGEAVAFHVANALTVTATGAASIAWQVLAPGDTVWLSAAGLPGVTGADTASLAFTLTPPALHGYQFRALLTSADGHVFTTSVATLSSYPSRYYVNPARSGTDDGDGLAWATAFRSLDHALATIPVDPSDTEVWVAAGTHVPSAPSGFPLWGGLRLYGGFTGTETLLTERDPAAHLTVLAGTTGTTSVAHTETRGPAASALRLDGFTFTSAPRAVLVSSGVIADLANNTFQSLTTNAIEATGGTVHVSASRFLQNQRGILATATTLSIDRTEFRGNHAPSSDGAALSLGLRSVAEISNSLFSGNRAVRGGAIRLQGRATFLHVTFTGNYATNQGAALYGTTDSSSGQFLDGAFSIFNSIVFANRTPSGGALNQQISTSLSNYLFSVRGSVLENWSLTLSAGNANNNTADAPDFLTPILAADAPTTAGDFHLGGAFSIF